VTLGRTAPDAYMIRHQQMIMNQAKLLVEVGRVHDETAES
jgi:hypothetical protein